MTERLKEERGLPPPEPTARLHMLPGGHLGERLVIASYVISQFIDLTLFTVGGLVVSIQKLTALLLLPIGALMLRRIVVRLELVGLALLVGLAFSAVTLVGGRSDVSLDSTLVTVALNFAAAVLLSSALTPPSGTMLRFFGLLWIACSVVTALLAVGQLLSIVPLLGDAANSFEDRGTDVGLVRGTGLKFDPNFAAMLLVVGLAFSQYLRHGRQRIVVSVIIALGAAATLSRMGTLLACVVLVLTAAPAISFVAAPLRKLARISMSALVIGLVGFAVLQLSPPEVRVYLADRTADLESAYQVLVLGEAPEATGYVNEGSGVQRADLNAAALGVFTDNWAVGVGASGVPAAIGRITGNPAPAHNTYLETIGVGGLFGVGLLLFYVGVVGRLISRASRDGRVSGSREPQRLVWCIRLVLVAIAAMAFVLTLDYIAFFWLPMVLAIAVAVFAESVHQSQAGLQAGPMGSG